ncbi:MAG: hypothetical protein Q8K99_09655 [Actinomycetota bacterium]|nr:hypothetical protein [Actinomycetota bacterium]
MWSGRLLRRLGRSATLAAFVAVILLSLVGIGYPSDIPIATIPVGDAPVAIAVNPVSHAVYVANYYGNTVSVIDGVSDSVVATATMPESFSVPISIVVDSLQSPAKAFVANFWAACVAVIDESAPGAPPVAVDTGAVHASGPRALAIDPTLSPPKVYAANYGSGTIAVINATTNAVVGHIAVGTAPRALGMFSSASRHRLYAADASANTVTVIDPTTDTVITTIGVGAAPKSIAVDPATGYAYVSNETGDSVTVIDDTDAVAATIPVGDRPVGIAVDSANRRVFVANFYSGTVSVIDADTNTVTATIPVGTNPYAVAFDASDGKAFVTNYGSANVTVISNTLATTTVATGVRPYAVAVNEGISPHKTYVGNWTGDSVTVIDEPAPVALGFVTPSVAHAAAPPAVAVAVEPLPGDATTSTQPVIEGTAEDLRSPYVSNIVGVYYRLDNDVAWQRAEIVEGLGSPSVRWRVASPVVLEYGTHKVHVAALDQAAAVSATSEFGSGFAGQAFGGSATYGFTVTEYVDVQTPVVRDTVAVPAVASVGQDVMLFATADDTASGASTISSVEYRVDDGAWTPMSAIDLAFDEPVEPVAAVVPAFTTAGLHTVEIRATDAAGNTSGIVSTGLVVFDSAGSVSGNGKYISPVGSFVEEPALSCQASLKTDVEYPAGSTVPEGLFRFESREAGVFFGATSFDWMVVAAGKAYVSGSGRAKDGSAVRFTFTVRDGGTRRAPDYIRLRLVSPDGSLLYDSAPGTVDLLEPVNQLTQGNISL